MADRGDTHYRVPTLNVWFALSSVLLLVTTVWMVIDDYNRPWKQYQRDFRQIEIAKLEEQRAALQEEGVVEREAELMAQIEAAEADLAARRERVDELAKELRQAQAEYWRLNEEAKAIKAEYNWQRFLVEEQRVRLDDETYGADVLAEMELAMNESISAAEAAQDEFDAVQARMKTLTAQVEEARSRLSGETRDLARVRGRIDQLAPTELDKVLAQKIRDDIPGLDFIGPTIKVRKELPPDLTFDLNFTRKQRIDMCHTCHMGIDREGFEDVEEPFTTHPRLDLYLTAKSPHPIKQFGCTICHRGSGEALDFVRADHRPASDEQAAQWEDEHHWEKQHHWDYPMLSSDMVEASCVQCHKDSMELIADDAPVVSRGYELFERYGCYSCHKVDWFPTDRKPGPSLKNIQTKVTPEFMASWIADPRAFRPSTWMPQIFHLENYAAEEVVTTSKYGAGRDILGQEWNDTAVDAITAFVIDRAPVEPLEPPPVQGDAYRGREVMRLVGCYACHNVAPWDGEPQTFDPVLEARDTNTHGPNLRGVATKVTPEWLYNWIKDPASIWSETRMPNLRLTDQEAADVVAYVMEDPDGVFTDTPDGWAERSSPSSRDVLEEQARWYFARDGRATIERRLGGDDPAHPWDDDRALRVAVGERLVTQYGCYSCHDIQGMEDMMPIGVELSNWGSKTVDKLDFGFAYKKKLGGRPKLDHHYREGWLKRKLEAPRSYDLEKVKNPTEKLRMGWFDLEQDEIDALATFVVGLVDDEVTNARMEPTHAELAMDAGMRVVRQKNCLACHSVDPGTVTFRDGDGDVHTVQAEVTAFEGSVLPMPHDEVMDYLAEFAEEDDVEEVGFRLLRTEPDVGEVGSRVFVPVEDFLGATPPAGGEFVRVVTDYYLNGGIELFDPEAESEDDAYYYVTADPDEEGGVGDVDGEFRTYYDEPYDKVRWTFAPPVLWDEGHKLHGEWFYSFLHDVQPIRPQLRVRMPSFAYADGEAEAVVDYFAAKSVVEWPARYTRDLRMSLGMTAAELGGEAGVSADVVLEIEDGYQPTIDADFPKVVAYGQARGFERHGPVPMAYEARIRRSPTYLAQRTADLGRDPTELGEALATDAVNCFQCHFQDGNPPPDQPIAWAPDLAIVPDRLRDDWTHEWMAQPQLVYPGTSMPANFANDPPQYQDVFPDSTNEEQIQVVLDWLYNLGRTIRTARN